MLEDYSLESPYYQMIVNGKTDLRINNPGFVDLQWDPARKYKLNDHGYRSEDFSSNADILIGGCSHTFGTGIEEDLRWGNVLAKKLNIVPQTISESGKSISWIVEKIMCHISIFGTPQTIVCLFPDPFRHLTIIDSKVLKSVSFERDLYSSGYEEIDDAIRGQATIHTETEQHDARNIKYLKKPFDVRTVVSRDSALHQSIRSIRFLEKYCNDLGVPLTWGTWDFELNSIANDVLNTDYKFDNFVDVINRSCATYRKTGDQAKDVLFESMGENIKYCQSNHKNTECNCHLRCHEDYLELVGPEQFYMASDTLNGIQNAHFGAHVHMHFAEAFLAKINPVE